MNDLTPDSINVLSNNIKEFILVFTPLMGLILKFHKQIVMPIASFFNGIPNRSKNKIYSICRNLNKEFNKDLNKDVVTDCYNELIMLEKMTLVQSTDRMKAIYFYELINLLKHTVPYNKFKRLYPYLYFINNEILIDNNKIKDKRKTNYIWATICFLVMICFSGFFVYSNVVVDIKSRFLYYALCLFLVAFSEVSGFYYLNLIIKNKEIDYFNNIKNIYHEKVIAKLKDTFGDIFTL